MASLFKSGSCWECGDKGDVIYSKLNGLGFLCLKCAIKNKAIDNKCMKCGQIYDCRLIAAGTIFVCNVKED